MKYEFITIEKIKNRISLGRPVYEVKNNKTGNFLAKIYYYKPYKKYVFESMNGKIFANTCLRDIVDFLENYC